MSAARQICNGLKKYYKSLNHPYKNTFHNFCVEEEFIDLNDEQLLLDELECQDAKESRLVEFYKNDYEENIFPFNGIYQNEDEDVKQHRILSLIKQCYINPNIQFSNGDITIKHIMDETEEISPLSSQNYYEFMHELQSQSQSPINYSPVSTTSTVDNLIPLYMEILEAQTSLLPDLSLAPLDLVVSPTPIEEHSNILDIVNETPTHCNRNKQKQQQEQNNNKVNFYLIEENRNYDPSCDSDYDFESDLNSKSTSYQLLTDLELENKLIKMGCCCSDPSERMHDANTSSNDVTVPIEVRNGKNNLNNGKEKPSHISTDNPNEDEKYDEERAGARLLQILDLLNNHDLDDDELRTQLAEFKPKTVEKVSSEIQTLHRCMQRIVGLSTVTPKQLPQAPSFSTPSSSKSAAPLSDSSSFKRKPKTNIIKDHPKYIQTPIQELIENTERKQDEYYCEPSTSIRAQNNIFISRELTSKIIPSRTQINFQNVKCYFKHKPKNKCKCDGPYLWLDMDIAMQFKYNKYRSKKQKVFNTGFTDANTKDELFCMIEAVTNNEDDRKSEAKQHPWEMKKKLCTAKMIMDECRFEKNQLPKPIRQTKQFLCQLEQATAIKEYLNDSRNKLIEKTKWCRVKVFARLNNKRRKVLSIEQYEFREELKRNQAFKMEDMELIPILMFKGEKYQIHHIIRVPVDGSHIAISTVFEEKQKKVKVTGIHMNISVICKQHQWIDLDHLGACHCFDNFNMDLDDLRIGDIDSEIKRLRQKNKDLKSENQDLKDELTKQMQIYQESNGSSSHLIDFKTGYESTSSSNVSTCSK